MISSLYVENIRSFDDGPWIFSLAPLSVFCGTNSAGKSTLIKLPLLLRQTIYDSHLEPHRLRFNGSYIDLGSYEALVTQHDLKRALKVGIAVPMSISEREVAFWLGITSNSSLGSDGLLGNDEELGTVVASFTVRADGLGADIVERVDFALRTGGEQLAAWTFHRGTTSQPALSIGVNEFSTLFADYGSYRFVDVLDDGGIRSVAADGRGLIPPSVLGEMTLGDQTVIRTLPLPNALLAPMERWEAAVRAVDYPGPLRTPAERFYFTRGRTSASADVSGDSLPYILRDGGSLPVDAPAPSGDDGTPRPLVVALDLWLHFLRTGIVADPSNPPGEVTVSSTRDVLVEVAVTGASGSGRHALADSGFGYSQVLPILVRGLQLPVGHTLVVEQPELHLHPALQIRLGEFFVALARAGRQVVLETHSEHLVNALRVAAAEDETGALSEAMRIYFIDGDVYPPMVHELAVQADGTVPEWPANFFGEALTLSGRLLRAQRHAPDR